MKLEKLESRLKALRQNPADSETLERILRMIGDELPRYRKDILGGARARMAATASSFPHRGDPDVLVAVSAIKTLCTVIASYEIAAAKRHCALCENPLLDYFVLQVEHQDFSDAHLCGACITEAITSIRPDIIPIFHSALNAYRLLEALGDPIEEPFGLHAPVTAEAPKLPGLSVRRASFRRNT